MSDYEPLLEASVDIAADPEVVWSLVADVTRMAEWSPQVTSTRLRNGFDAVALGAQFTNRNVNGDMEWTTHAEVVTFTPAEKFAFRVEENWVVWSFTLAPTDGGTRLTQRREAPDGISELSLELTDGFMGGQAAFTKVMREGMSETLAAIKATAET